MAEQYFLRISGVKGGSTDKQYKDAIPLTSFQFGAGVGIGANRQPSPPSFSEVTVTMAEGPATPQLLALLASGTPADTAEIDGRITVGTGSTATQVQQLQISMTNVFITGVSESAGSGGPPADSASLNYGTIRYSYTPIVNGKPGTPITFQFSAQNGLVKQSELEH
jgi:type VI protein secretion system component Hcp